MLDYMRFLDPHGVERVDAEVFECTAQRHTYASTPAGVRLLAADGVRPPAPERYSLTGSELVAVDNLPAVVS